MKLCCTASLRATTPALPLQAPASRSCPRSPRSRPPPWLPWPLWARPSSWRRGGRDMWVDSPGPHRSSQFSCASLAVQHFYLDLSQKHAMDAFVNGIIGGFPAKFITLIVGDAHPATLEGSSDNFVNRKPAGWLFNTRWASNQL